MSGKVVLEWLELDGSRCLSWVKPNFDLSKFIVITLQEIKLPNDLQFSSFLSEHFSKIFALPNTTLDHV